MKTLGVRGFLLLLALSQTAFLTAESLRGPFKGAISPDSAPIAILLEDIAQIDLPPSTRFTRALEIEVQIPREILPYRSAFAVFVYQNFQAPAGSVPASGDRTSIEVLPPSGKFYLQAPLISKAGLKAAVDTAVLKLPLLDKAFPLGISILPIDKEWPQDFQKIQFLIKTRTDRTQSL